MEPLGGRGEARDGEVVKVEAAARLYGQIPRGGEELAGQAQVGPRLEREPVLPRPREARQGEGVDPAAVREGGDEQLGPIQARDVRGRRICIRSR